MAELLDLLDAGPMIALAIACVLMVSVLVVVFLQMRRIGRLERQLAERGESAEDAPLRRIAELQARHEMAAGGSVGSRAALRPALVIGAVVVAVALAGGGAWFFLGGGDGPAEQGAQAAAPGQTETQAAQAPAPAPDPLAATTVPASIDIPPIPDTSAFTVKVFNASGTQGAAGSVVAPRLANEGFNMLESENYPTGETDVRESVVMFNGDENQAAAWNIATVLGVKRAPRLEGLTVDQIQGADVVVVVGADLANSMVSSETP